MGFPKKVREDLLLRSARHCCVCRRARGVKVEVHHIVPEAEGGTNEIENGIVLCFDCHADAGHYNPNHPRGTKFSQSELRRARDSWFNKVETEGVEPKQLNDLHFRYYFTKNLSVIQSLCSGGRKSLPSGEALLVQSDEFAYICNLVGEYGGHSSRGVVWGDRFESLDDYMRRHPDAIRTSSSEDGFAYYDAIRYPSSEEISQRVAPEDFLVRLLLEGGVDPKEICMAAVFDDGCGGVPCREQYLLKPAAALFLSIQNCSKDQILIEKVVGHRAEVGPENMYRRSYVEGLKSSEIAIPRTPLLSGERLWLALGIILLPYELRSAIRESTVALDIAPGRWLSEHHLSSNEEVPRQDVCGRIGPFFMPEIACVKGGKEEPVHEFSFSSIYRVDEDWAAGSCPFLFAYDGYWKFVSPLFEASKGKSISCEAKIRPTVTRIAIVELEDEVSWVDSIWIDGLKLTDPFVLKKNEYKVISLPSLENDGLLTLKGGYKSQYPSMPNDNQCLVRNELLLELSNSWNCEFSE